MAQTLVVGTQIAIYLEQLKNVSITSPVTNQGLVYNGTNWVNQTLSSGGGATTLAALTDVAIATPLANQVLTYSGGHWINAVLPTGNAGTVTTSLGALTANAVVLGNGGADTKVLTSFTTDGVSVLNLGISGTSTGGVQFRKAATGTTAMVPANTAGTFTVTVPSITDTLVARTTADTLTNKTLTSPTINSPTISSATIASSTLTSPTINSPVMSESQDQQASAPATNNSYTGFVLTGVSTGVSVTQWQPVYMASTGKWALASGSSANFVTPCRGLAVATAAANAPVAVIYSGRVRNDAWSWTIGGDIYVDTTAGTLTQTTTSLAGGSGNAVQKVGWALTATVMVVNVGNADYFVTA